MPNIEFLRNLFVALLWKTFVLLSPLLSHKTLDLWFHILDSLSVKMFISAFRCWTDELLPLTIASSSAKINNFFFASKSRLTVPKLLWFHQVRSFSHLAIFLKIRLSLFGSTVLVHVASTVSPHLTFDNHISSNLNIFLLAGISNPVKFIKRARWSEELHGRWNTLVPGNFKNQFFAAKPHPTAPKSNSHYQNVFSRYIWDQ